MLVLLVLSSLNANFKENLCFLLGLLIACQTAPYLGRFSAKTGCRTLYPSRSAHSLTAIHHNRAARLNVQRRSGDRTVKPMRIVGNVSILG
ncbi:hypothetical protein BKA93DRAFT_572544 [Sparassis latifolia]